MKIFRFVKKVFFIGLTILSDFINASSLSCISIKNKECKTRLQVVNVNSNNPIFFPISIKISKCSGNYNNINDPYTKICVPDIIKNLNVKVFNLMSRTNWTKFIEWHENCKYICRSDAIVCNNKQRWNKNKCRVECKELIDKEICDKAFVWNPRNCECEWDKNCDIGEYLDYKNCKRRKKLVVPIINECTETIREVKIANITLTENENNYKYNSCKVYIVFMIVFFNNIYWNYYLLCLLQMVFD